MILAAEASGDPPPKAIEDVAEKLITKKLSLFFDKNEETYMFF